MSARRFGFRRVRQMHGRFHDFGYTITKMFNGTEIAHCVDHSAADGATLARYWQEIDRNKWRKLVDLSARLPGKAR
jgi:hypothetical protein